MGLFTRRNTTTDHKAATTHIVEVHFAQPVLPASRHEHEDGIVDRLLPQLGASGRSVGGGTALTPDGEPESADIVIEVTAANIGEVVGELTEVLERNGICRGSWISVDGGRRAIGRDEYVLLRTRLGEEHDDELPSITKALQHALGDGEVGWHDDTYRGHDGIVYIFSGSSAAAILKRLRAEIPRHALLAAAELLSA